MTIKIIGAGFGRTGTMSLKQALNTLGFPCYHMDQVDKKENSGHINFWYQVSQSPEGTQHSWDTVFENYTASLDYPASCVWRELMVAYPDAKVLLTEHPRGAEAWYKSTISTIYAFEARREFKIMHAILPFVPKFFAMTRELIWRRTLKNTMDNPDAAVDQYKKHIEEVKATVPPENLLVFSVDQGWEPLCKFLNVDIPDGTFPKVNETAELKKIVDRVGFGIYSVLTLGAAAIIWLIYTIAL